MSTGSKLIAVTLVILALGALRFVHLAADTPSSVTPTGLGLYVDEGYKTLAAHRLALFGTTRWDPADRFSGWMEESPLTQWSFYAGFRLFGTKIETARAVTVVYFVLFLAGFAFAFWHRYRGALLFAGLLALGFESTLFFYSRTALFAIPLMTCIYLLVFGIARLSNPRPFWVVAGVLLLGGVPTFGVKSSAAIYLMPIVAAPILFVLLRHGVARRLWPVLVGVAVCGAVVLYATTAIWMPRLNFVPSEIIGRLLFNPTVDASTFVMLAGLLCAIHGLLTRADLYLHDLYRLTLILIIGVTPLVFTLFVYHPLRYYVPILPAYVLMVLEWVHLEGWKQRLPAHTPRIVAALAVAALALCVFYDASAFNRNVLARFGLELGRLPGISETAVRVLLPFSVAVAVAIWIWRRVTFSPKVLAFTGWAITGLFAIQSSTALISFLTAPSYRAQLIRADLARIIGTDQTMAGDWAPFFAIGTNIKSFYIHRRENPGSDVRSISPSYFLYSPTYESDVALEQIRAVPGVFVEEAIYESEYNGRPVVLYPLRYEPVLAADRH